MQVCSSAISPCACSLATATASLACCDGLLKLASGHHSALRQHCFDVPHVQQSFNWCAFTCLPDTRHMSGHSNICCFCNAVACMCLCLHAFCRHRHLLYCLSFSCTGSSATFCRHGACLYHTSPALLLCTEPSVGIDIILCFLLHMYSTTLPLLHCLLVWGCSWQHSYVDA